MATTPAAVVATLPRMPEPREAAKLAACGGLDLELGGGDPRALRKLTNFRLPSGISETGFGWRPFSGFAPLAVAT